MLSNWNPSPRDHQKDHMKLNLRQKCPFIYFINKITTKFNKINLFYFVK